MAERFLSVRQARPNPPFPLVNNPPSDRPASGPRREAAKRTLDGEDRSGIIQREGKGGTAGRESTTGRLHKGTVVQRSDAGRVFKALGVAKHYCKTNVISDTFMQC